MSGVRAALVPGVPALLPAYAGQVDPVADLRSAACSAVADLVALHPSRVLVVCAPVRPDVARHGVTVPLGLRVAQHLLSAVGHRGDLVGDGPADAVLLVGNGSACRSEKAPGHLDPRSAAFDDSLGRAVRGVSPPPVDEAAAEELWCFDLPVFRRLHELAAGPADVRYADDPYGVACWVATWPEVGREVTGTR